MLAEKGEPKATPLVCGISKMPFSRLFSVVLAFFLAQAFVAQAELLQLRFNWAPIFCFAGSSNGVPKEFCGLEGASSIPRFMRHRQSLLRPLGGKCSKVSEPFDPAALSPAVRKHWACTNPSYTTTTADQWYARIWETGLGCAASKLGMGQAEAFEFMTSLWDRYQPDAALAKSRVRLWTKSKIRTASYLKALKRAYGHDPFVTCDGGTGTKLSTVSICIDTTSKVVAACPKKVLRQYKKRCPSKLVIERGNGSVKSVAPECMAYYS